VIFHVSIFFSILPFLSSLLFFLSHSEKKKEGSSGKISPEKKKEGRKEGGQKIGERKKLSRTGIGRCERKKRKVRRTERKKP
jgi:hypothetical protein